MMGINSRRVNWIQILVTALVTGIVTIITTIIIFRLQEREAHLIYSTNEAIPFTGENEVIAIYQVLIGNTGKKAAENVDCHIRIQGATIEERRIKLDPTIKYSSIDNKEAVILNFPLLNPTEEVQVSILAKAPIDLPSRPEIAIRGKGIFGEEAHIREEPENLITRISSILAPIAGIIAGFLTLVLTFRIREKYEKRPIFYDDFEGTSWQNYERGEVVIITKFAHTGNSCLKKDKNSDPHGGFKRLEQKTELGIVLSGWIFSPSRSTGGLGDRIAVEDEKFNGYGFTVAHNSNLIWIDRRDKGVATVIGSQINCPVHMGKWYQFKFYMRIGGKFDLRLYDDSGREFFYTKDISDNKYNKFDRVVVHGGYPYYIDELKIEKI